MIPLYAFIFVFIFIDLSGAMGQRPQEQSSREQKSQKKKQKDDVSTKKGSSESWLPPELTLEEKAEWQYGRPPGWNRGKKTGWKGADMPPGLSKKVVNPLRG